MERSGDEFCLFFSILKYIFHFLDFWLFLVFFFNYQENTEVYETIIESGAEIVVKDLQPASLISLYHVCGLIFHNRTWNSPIKNTCWRNSCAKPFPNRSRSHRVEMITEHEFLSFLLFCDSNLQSNMTQNIVKWHQTRYCLINTIDNCKLDW